jgi:hypothetical protein
MSRDDDRLLDAVRRAWGRPGSSPAERSRFEADLRARLEQPSRRPVLLAGLGLGFAAAIAVIVLVPRARPPQLAPASTPSWVSLAAQGAGLPVATTADEVGLGVAFEASDGEGTALADDDGLGTLVASGDDDGLGSLLPRRLVGLARWLEPPSRTAEELGDQP